MIYTTTGQLREIDHTTTSLVVILASVEEVAIALVAIAPVAAVVVTIRLSAMPTIRLLAMPATVSVVATRLATVEEGLREPLE